MNELLKESLCLQPLIQENPFLKSYLSLYRLQKRFSTFDSKFLSDIWSRQDIASYPKAKSHICSSIVVPQLFAEREKRMLSRGLYPSVYGIVLKKIEALGARTVLKPYLRMSIEDPGYLGHRWTGAIALWEMWPLVEADEQLKLLWVDRATEFIISFNISPTDYSLRKVEPSGDETFKETLKATLLKPGNFGGHLVALAATKRFENELLKNETRELWAKILAMTQLKYSDADDFVVINPVTTSESLPDLEKTITNYLKQGPEDPYTLIFADAMVTLWDVADEIEKSLILSNITRFMRR